MRHLRSSILVCLLAVFAAGGAAFGQTGPGQGPHYGPPTDYFQRQHPQHRLAYWYANESVRQSREAREMVCGFTGQHWTLDWEVHYRWALRASPRRAYGRVEDRDRHLSTCRSRKLRDYQREPYRRHPGGYRRDGYG